MSLSEQFIQHYFTDKNGNDADIGSVRNKEAELLCGKLKLDNDGMTGFVLTKKQFGHLSNSFVKYTKESYGLYRLQFHPKSGHVIHDSISGYGYGSFDVYPTRGLSDNFKYFQWSFNGLFCKDWIKFYETIKDTNCQYIAIKHIYTVDPRSGLNYIILCSYDPIEDQYHQLPTHMGGGRLNHEPSAIPYQIMDEDVVVNGVEEPVYIKSANKY